MPMQLNVPYVYLLKSEEEDNFYYLYVVSKQPSRVVNSVVDHNSNHQALISVSLKKENRANIDVETSKNYVSKIDVRLHEKNENIPVLIEIESDQEDVEVESYILNVTATVNPKINVHITPGNAPQDEIAALLADISMLYRKTGGSGISFILENISITENEVAI